MTTPVHWFKLTPPVQARGASLQTPQSRVAQHKRCADIATRHANKWFMMWKPHTVLFDWRHSHHHSTPRSANSHVIQWSSLVPVHIGQTWIVHSPLISFESLPHGAVAVQGSYRKRTRSRPHAVVHYRCCGRGMTAAMCFTSRAYRRQHTLIAVWCPSKHHFLWHWLPISGSSFTHIHFNRKFRKKKKPLLQTHPINTSPYLTNQEPSLIPPASKYVPTQLTVPLCRVQQRTCRDTINPWAKSSPNEPDYPSSRHVRLCVPTSETKSPTRSIRNADKFLIFIYYYVLISLWHRQLIGP